MGMRYLFITALILSGYLVDVNSEVFFRKVSLKSGLSNSTVYSIAQDSKGSMWFGTFDGLNKFDGYRFTVYRHQLSDSSSICSNHILCVKRDSADLLWIGTTQGISVYNSQKEEFTNFRVKGIYNPVEVYDIAFVKQKQILLGAHNGLFVLNRESNKISEVSLFSGIKVFSVLAIDNYYLVGTLNGLYKYYPVEKKSVLYGGKLSSCQVSVLLNHPGENQVWVGTEGDGLFLISLQSGEMKQFKHDKNQKYSISSNFIRSLGFDKEQKLWIGTFGGLNIFDPRKEIFHKYLYDISEEGSISQNSIRSIYCDAQGGMWFGTYFGGLNYYHPRKNLFQHLKHKQGKTSLNDNVVSCIVEDKKNGLFWIGTNDEGLNLYDSKNDSFKHFTYNEYDKRSLGSNNIKSILIDANDNLYIGTHGGGLFYYKPGTNYFERVFVSEDAIANKNVYSLEKGCDGTMWIGTLNGVYKYNLNTQKVVPLSKKLAKQIDNNKITYLKADSKKRLWIGTEKGLYLYSELEEKLEEIQVTQADIDAQIHFVTCVLEAEDGLIWIGTREGLFVYNDVSDNFVFLDVKSGLPNNIIYGILEDEANQFWISTNSGLACYIPEERTFKIYNDADGLQSNQFNMYSFCKAADGKMLFGGINGITSFYPDQMVANPYAPNPVITKLFLFNKQVTPDDDTGILSKSIENTRRIVLKAGQSVFGLEFVVSNFLAGTQNTFAYKLEGFDREWYYTNDIRQINYSNLKPGEYRFLVKAANNDGVWNATPTSLEINVLPNWYATHVAKVSFILLFFALCYFIWRMWSARQATLNSLKFAKMEKIKNEELNKLKMNFFTNVAHEFRTPLTLVLSPLNELLNRNFKEKWVRDQLETMNRSGNKLLNLVNLIMDYRKAESGVFKLKLSRIKATEFFNDIICLFSYSAKKKNINLLYDSGVKDKTYLLDNNYLERIVFNLLFNAFKFTPEGGTITLLVEEKDGCLHLAVTDNGPGIPPEKTNKIFNNFYKLDETLPGTGIGLSLVQKLVQNHHGTIEVSSEPYKNTQFLVKLPVDEAVYSNDERTSDIFPAKSKASDDFRIGVESLSSFDVNEIKNNPDNDEDHPLILIVEDDKEVLNYLRTSLVADYRVLTAENGKQGLDVLKREPEIDLIISDVMMPVMNGYEFCRIVKQNIRSCHIPVVLLTAKTETEDEIEGLSTGADDYIAKPFLLSVLQIKIRNILKMKKRMQYHFAEAEGVCAAEITGTQMDEELLNKALKIVEDNIDNSGFSAGDFSREMGMSRSNLHIKLKAITGESTVEFIRKIRINYACKLLKEGRYNVAEISVRTGFNSASYFATCFKKQKGCMPTEYLKKK